MDQQPPYPPQQPYGQQPSGWQPGGQLSAMDRTWGGAAHWSALVAAFDSLPDANSKVPTVVICDTVKGKGVDFMERNLAWHAGSLNEEDLQRALASLADGRKVGSA